MDETIRLLLIDDHSLFRDAIARLLAAQPDFRIAGECGTVDDGIRILKSVPVDIVLLDINLGLQQTAGPSRSSLATKGSPGKFWW